MAPLVTVLAWENYPSPGRNKAKDWTIFLSAAEALGQRTDLYESGSGGYVYPPLLAFLVTPIIPIGYYASARVWVGLSLGALVVALVLTVRETSERTFACRPPRRIGPAVLLALVVSLNVARKESSTRRPTGSRFWRSWSA